MNSQQSTVNNQQSTTHNPLFSFIGDEVDAGYEAAKVVILPIPYEATTTYRRGCERGPAALLEASEQLEYYDEELDWEVCWSVGIHTHAAIADTRTHPNLPSEEMLQVTRETVLNLIRDNKFVIALGGEHSITTGLVQAYCKAQPDSPLTVIQVDAHGDLCHEYEGSIYNHACVMRRIVDMGIPTLQIGIRSLCQEEANLIKSKKLNIIRARDIVLNPAWIEQALVSISTQRVFLTIDLDGIDPTLLPGVGTPEPGGLNWYALTAFLRRVFESYDVVGCDVMELAPVVDSVVSEFTAAKLVYKLVSYQALSKNWRG